MSTERWYIVGTVTVNRSQWLVYVDATQRWRQPHSADSFICFNSRAEAESVFKRRAAPSHDDAIVTGDEYDALVAADRARRTLEST